MQNGELENKKLSIPYFQSNRKLKNSSSQRTRYRQGIVQELTKGTRAGKVHSFWTNDGRIFAKLPEKGRKFTI